MRNTVDRFYATGRRKEAVACVWLTPGTGNIIINGKKLEVYFPLLEHQMQITTPLQITDTVKKYNIRAKIRGGGKSGQSGALTHGIARVLIKTDEDLKSTLKKKGLLQRDSRVKERKKYGRRKARAKPQFSKR